MCESRYDSVRSNMCRPSTQALRLAAMVLVPWYFGAVVQCLTLMIDRATASSLLVEISCDSCESNSFTWEYKSSPEETWGNLPRLIDHLYNPNAFYITKLKENTLHYLRVRYNPTGEYSNEIKEWTCEKVPPTVTDLRVASAGPGWLDVRWTRPQERCKSFYYYDVRYKPRDGLFSRTMRFGYFDVSHSKAYVKPSHPCSGGDFCVLLTDHVVAGSHHQIELKIERIGGENESSGEFRLSGLASTDNTGAEDFIVCPDTKKNPEDSSFDEETARNEHEDQETKSQGSGVDLALWVLILMGNLFFIVFATMFGLCVKYSITTTVHEERTDEVEMPPAEYMEERYVDPGEMGLSATKMSEYDEDLYEEINIEAKTPS